MSLPRAIGDISVEEYLEGEPLSDVKHEYIAGQVYAMAGASEQHNQIAQDDRRVEVYRRDDSGWWRHEILGPEDGLRLESLPVGPLTMAMDEVYEDVEFTHE
jgi:Uma2 family endonuclease